MQRRIEGHERNTILVSGYAKLPEAEGKGEYAVFGLVLEVDLASDIIVEAECSCNFELGREFFRRLVVGYNLISDIDSILSNFENRFVLAGQKTVIRSCQNAYNRYREFKMARGVKSRAAANYGPHIVETMTGTR